MKTKKIFFIENVDFSFLDFRTDIALEAKRRGCDITIVAKDLGRGNEIRSLGFNFIDMPMNRTGMNIIEELHTLHFLCKLLKRERPTIVENVGLKAILWGNIAAKYIKGVNSVNLVNGLGSLFKGDKVTLLDRMILLVIKMSMKFTTMNIFQNKDDMRIFDNAGILKKSSYMIISGSGVDLDKFNYVDDPCHKKVRILFVGRMIKEKGITDLLDAADLLRENYQEKVEFVLCGAIDENPSGISESELLSRCDGNYIKWIGLQKNMPKQYELCNIMTLPSYYREGIPRVLIEATSIGRPIVTTESVGCKETVEDGVNGFKVPIKSPTKLAECFKKLIDDRELRIKMGKASRKMAEENFSIKNVVEKHMQIFHV